MLATNEPDHARLAGNCRRGVPPPRGCSSGIPAIADGLARELFADGSPAPTSASAMREPLHRVSGFGAQAHPIDHHCLGAHARGGEGRHGDELVFEIAQPGERRVRLGLGRVDTEFCIRFGLQGLVSIMGRQNFGESISIRLFKERVGPTILDLARMAIVDVAILLAAPPRDRIDGISVSVTGRGKHGLIAQHRTQAIMYTFRLFIDVRLPEYRGVEAQQLAVAPIWLARSKPAQCVCQLGG